MIVASSSLSARVQVVDDGLGELSLGVQAVEEARQRLALREVADGVVAGVGAERAHRARAVVAHGAQVELLHPAARVVHHREVVEQRRAQLLDLARATAPGRARALAKIACRLALGVRRRVDAARGRGRRRGSRPRGRSRAASASASRRLASLPIDTFAAAPSLSTQPFQPAEVVHRQRLVGAPGRVELGAAPRRSCAWRRCGSRSSIGIVGAADDPHVVLREQALRGERRARRACGCSGRRSRARCRAPAACPSRRTGTRARGASSGRAGCAASAAPSPPRPRTSPSRTRRR